jgi:hypothetical protein
VKVKIISVLVTLVTLLLATGGIYSVYYIYHSRDNPHFLEIILGSILISLIVGILPSLIQKFTEKQVANRPWIWFGILCCFLGILVALLVYSSNAPKNIKAEIPVTYLVNLNTMELPSGLRFDSTITSVSYDQARCILKNFKDKNPENAQKIKQMLQANFVDTSRFEIICFQNLSEYLIAYYIGYSFTTPEFELALHRGESAKWLAFPHPTIRGESKPLDWIEGEFRNNLFYGIEAFPELDEKIELKLPKNTEVLLTRANKASSTFTIKNKFLEIKIEVWYLLGSSGYPAPRLPDSAFSLYVPKEQNGPFKRYNTVISYNVTFNRLRYAFPEMQYYEEWANDLLSMLQRKLSWGSPPYVDLTELLKRYEDAEKNSNR